MSIYISISHYIILVKLYYIINDKKATASPTFSVEETAVFFYQIRRIIDT